MNMSEHTTTKVGHCKQESWSVYIGRGEDQLDFSDVLDPEHPADFDTRGCWGNPFVTKSAGGKYTREQSVKMFRALLVKAMRDSSEIRAKVAALEGENLGCWCQRFDEDDGALCHGEVLAEYAEKLA